jgi:hypothetical protein
MLGHTGIKVTSMTKQSELKSAANSHFRKATPPALVKSERELAEEQGSAKRARLKALRLARDAPLDPGAK